MSDLENKKAEEAPKKRPYNLREKKEKKAAYRSLIRPEESQHCSSSEEV